MQKKWKVGIDARMFSDSFTGIGRYNFELTRRFFERKDLPIQWVIFMNEPEFSQFVPFNADVKSVCVDAPHYSFSEQTKFLRILNHEQCDLVHFTHFNVPLLYKKKFITTIHDTTISFYPGKKMNTWWRRKAYEKVMEKAVQDSTKIISVSENTKKDLIKLFHVDHNKITKIWNGIGDEFYEGADIAKQAVRDKFNISDTFILYTGVWREHKNVVGLIKAFYQILQKANQTNGPSSLKNLNLVMTGNPDPHYPEVQETIQKLNLTEKVRLVGLVEFEDLVNLYSAANAYVFPSFYEGFGMPPLEAMKCNTPVVASRISSIPEVCGEAVQYFDPHNIDDMAEKIINVLIDENLQKKLIKKGQQQVAQFSWDKAAEETLKIYLSSLE